MDFELNKTSLPYHRLMFHTTVSREESVEMIVPDSCPDIARLLDTSAICCLDTKEALEDTISLAGRIYGRILYLADGTDALCSLPAALDFQCGISQEGILIRMHAADINVQSRYGSGVRVMRLAESDRVVTVARSERDEENAQAPIEQPDAAEPVTEPDEE